MPRDTAKAEALYRAATDGGSINGKNNLAFEWADSGRNLDQALAYAREGAKVVINDVDPATAEATAKDVSGLAVVADVAKSADQPVPTRPA